MPVLSIFMLGYFLISLLFIHYYSVFDKRGELFVAVTGAVASMLLYSIYNPNAILMEGVRAFIGAASFDGLFFILVPAISFYSFIILLYLYLDTRVHFGIIKLILFSIVVFSIFIYGTINTEILIFGLQVIEIWFYAIGLLYIVFIAACHVVFSRIILFIDAIGFVLSIYFNNEIFYHEYFIILDLIPGFGDSNDIFIVVASVLMASYAFGVERGLFPAYPTSPP